MTDVPSFSVKIDSDLVEETDRLMSNLGLSRLSTAATGVLSTWIEPLNRENVTTWLRAVINRCKSRSYTNERLIPWILLAPAVRAAAEEDNAIMLDLQAQLVSGFRNRDRENDPNKSFIAILSEMRPIDFAVLQYVLSLETLTLVQFEHSRRVGSHPPWNSRRAALSLEWIAEALTVTAPQIALAAENLVRLGCFRSVNVPARALGPSHLPQNPAGCQIWNGETKYVPSELGIALLRAMDEHVASAE